MIHIRDTDIAPPHWNDLTLEMLLNCYTMMGLPAMRGTDVEVIWKRLAQAAWILGIDQAYLDSWRADCVRVHGEQEGKEVYLQELDIIVREATQYLWQIVDEDDGGDQSTDDDDDDTPTAPAPEPGTPVPPERWAISLTLTRCPYPELRLSGEQYYAPKQAWSNMTFYEFGMVWEYINAYMRTGEDELRSTLLAILYRPSKPDTPYHLESGYEGDRRQPVRKHESMIAGRAERWIQMPGMVQQVLTFWAICCRQYIYEAYIDVFGEPAADADPMEGPTSSGFPEMIMELAGNIVDIDKVADQNVHNVLMYIRAQKDKKPIINDK